MSVQPNTSTAVTGLDDVVPEVMYFTAVESVTIDQCSINLVERFTSETDLCEHENTYYDYLCDIWAEDEDNLCSGTTPRHETFSEFVKENCAKSCNC